MKRICEAILLGKAASLYKMLFRLRRVTFKGQGLAAELRDADWAEIRDLAYERGGERPS